MSFPNGRPPHGGPENGHNPCAVENGLSDEISGGGAAGHQTVHEFLTGVAEKRIRRDDGKFQVCAARSGIAGRFFPFPHHDPMVRRIYCAVGPNIARRQVFSSTFPQSMPQARGEGGAGDSTRSFRSDPAKKAEKSRKRDLTFGIFELL